MTSVEKKEALHFALKQRGIFTFCPDIYHACCEKCSFFDAYGDGRFHVCAFSLQVHKCRRSNRGEDPCPVVSDGFSAACTISSRELENAELVVNLPSRGQHVHSSSIFLPLTSKQRRRADQTRALNTAMGTLIARLFRPSLRENYNKQPQISVRLFVETIKRLVDGGDGGVGLASRVCRATRQTRYRLYTGRVRASRLLRLEATARRLLTRALWACGEGQKSDYVCNNPYESCVYVLRCVLEGFGKNDVNLLRQYPNFGDLAPMPSDRELKTVFGIVTTNITGCSLILQEALNKALND